MSAAAVANRPYVDHVTDLIISSAMKVHSSLGSGLPESAYEACLLHELRRRGLRAESQVTLPVVHDGVTVDMGYRMDLVVEDSVLVELRCAEAFNPVHEAQLLSYLKLSGKHVGLLINFHAAHLRDGIKTLVEGRDWQE